MKQSLQFKFSQQLSMTPQLQQAIKLLQLSTLELQQEVQQALEENPLLELEQAEAEGETALNDDDDLWDSPCSAALGQSSGGFDGEDSVFEGATHTNLHDHLIWQMQLSHFSALDETIALAIIDAIDDSGYL